MDDIDDRMDDFLTYSIVSGEFDDEKAGRKQDAHKRDESPRYRSDYSSPDRRNSTIIKSTKKKKTKDDSSIEKKSDGIPQKGKEENDNWKIYVVVCAFLFAILCILYIEFFYE